MASDLQIQGEVVVNSEQAEGAFNRVGDKAQQMANEVATSAGKAGQAVDKIGDGAGASAEKFTRAESRISASIKRATNELELLGKTASQRLEFNIADKGLDAAKFEPALKKLREIEAQALQAQRAATGSLDKMGLSAKQTAAALRGVPAQFTDIVTSLQGGQAPLTVLLQQGGQLKDMFGGAGNAARALGGYVLGLVNPLTIAAAAAGALAFAYNQGSKEADAYNKALITTGNAAGTNAAQLKAYAQEISGIVGTQGKAAESLAALASTGKVGAESLRDAAKAAVEYERATGQAVGKTAEQFASLRNEPLAAVLKLNDGMNFLTESTYKQIKSLEEQGKTAEAANVAQRAFADTLSSRAGEMERNLGSVERGWLAVKDAAKGALDAILNVGRASTNADQLAEVRRKIAERESQIANAGFATNGGGAAFGRPSLGRTEQLRAELAGLQAQAVQLEGVANQTRVAAEEERKRGEALKASAAFDKAGEKFLSDKAKMERELAAARVLGAEAGKSQAAIEERLREIRESYAKKGASNTATENKELRDQMRVLADLAGVSSTYYAELANYQKQREQGFISEKQYVGLVEDLIQKQPFAVAMAKDQAEATRAQAKAAEEASRSYLKYLDSFNKGADSAERQVATLQAEEQASILASQGYYSLAQAVELVSIARLKEQQIGLLGNEEAYLAVQREIEAREKLVGLIGSREARKASEDAAKDAQRDWERAAADIERSLTDSLLRGFESGKDFAMVLRDTIVNMFKTMVLRPIISAAVNPIAGAITGSLGLAGAANAATGAASGVGVLGSTLGALGTGLGAGASMIAGGGIGGWLSASTSLMGTGTLAGGMAGLGALAGPIGAVLAIGSLIKSLDDSGTFHTGGLGSYSRTGGAAVGDAVKGQGLGFDLASKDYTASSQQAASQMAQAIAGMLDSTAETFGSKAGYFAATAFADDTSKDGAWGALMVKIGDQMVLDWKNGTDRWPGREFADGEAGAKQYAAAVATDIRDYLITQTPDWADAALTALGEAFSLEALAETVGLINQVQNALTTMGDASKSFAAVGEDVSSRLVAALGGAQAAAASMGSYYGNFYSDTERQAVTKGQFTAAAATIGITDLPATRAAYRQLVDDTLAAGQTDVAAALIKYSDVFASFTENVNTSAASLSQASAPVADNSVLKGLQSDELNLRIQEAQAYGDTAEEIRLLTQGMSDFEVELFLSNRSLAENIAAQQRVNSLVDERKTLEIELLQAQGNTTGALTLLTASMGEAERAAYMTNEGIRAQIKGAGEATDLNQRLLTAQEDTAGLRALELAALEEANRPLLARIYALEDEAKAAEKAKEATEKLNESIASLVSAADNTAGKYLSGTGLEQYRYARAAENVNALGVGTTSATQLQAASVADIQAAVLQVVLLGNAAPEVKAQLINLGASLIDLKQAAIDTAAAAAKSRQDQQRGMQKQIAELSGDYTTLVLLRQQEIDQMDGPLNRAMARYIDQLQEQARAAEKAASRQAQQTSLQRQIADLSEDKATQLAFRELEVSLLDGPLNQALQRYIYTLQDQKTALEDATKNTDAAYSALERAVAAQRKAAETQRAAAQSLVQEVGSIFDALKTNVQSLYGEVDSTKQFQGAAGQAFISSALAAARAGGGLPDGQDLADAIAAARDSIGGTQYATQAEADFQRVALAGELRALQDISGTQLSEAERQLKVSEDQLTALDNTLEAAKAQIDALRGIDTSVISVELAVSRLALAIAAESTAKAMAAGTSPAVGGLANAANGITQTAQLQAAQAAEQKLSGLLAATQAADALHAAAVAANETSKAAYNATLAATVANPDTSPAFAAAAAAALKANADPETERKDLYRTLMASYANHAMVTDDAKALYWKAAGLNGLPSFAAGGTHAGGWAMVGEQGPELAYLPPARIYTAPQTTTMLGGNTERLARLVESLTAEVQRLQVLVGEGNQNTSQLADQFDRVTANGNAMATEVLA